MIEYTVRVYPKGDKSWYLNGKLTPGRRSCCRVC